MSLVISTSPGPLFWCARGCPCMCLPLGSTSLACRMWSLAVIHPVAPVEFDYFLNYMHTDTHDFHEGFWIHSLVPSFLGCQGVEIHDPCLLSELKSMRRLVFGSEEVRHEERLFLDAGSQKCLQRDPCIIMWVEQSATYICAWCYRLIMRIWLMTDFPKGKAWLQDANTWFKYD